MWTAFGIMLGFIAGVAFGGVKIPAGVDNTQWRIILGSTAIPPLIVCIQVYLVPESPRWYMSKGRYDKAFESLQRFRWSRFQAARDLYYIHKQIAIEYELQEGKNLWKEFFMIPRNRRAAQSSFFVMFMQQVWSCFQSSQTNTDCVPSSAVLMYVDKMPFPHQSHKLTPCFTRSLRTTPQ